VAHHSGHDDQRHEEDDAGIAPLATSLPGLRLFDESFGGEVGSP
jgi:hypothetical protein